MLDRIKNEILLWPQSVKLSDFDDIPDIIDTSRLEPLGEGKFGSVYKAPIIKEMYDLKSGTYIAIKELNLNKLSQALIDASDLKIEILAMSTLSEHCSIHVAKYYDVIFTPKDDLLYILMEYVDGFNINQHTMWGDSEEWQKHENIARKLVEGLQCLHEHEVAHRDIKPENVLVSEDLSVLKWVDLGFSCVTACKIGQDPTKVGTPLFLAPEIMNGEISSSSLKSWQIADLYSFGLLLHEMCGGKIKLSTTNGGGKPVGDIKSESEFVDTLMNACLINDPEERYERWQVFLEKPTLLQSTHAKAR